MILRDAADELKTLADDAIQQERLLTANAWHLKAFADELREDAIKAVTPKLVDILFAGNAASKLPVHHLPDIGERVAVRIRLHADSVAAAQEELESLRPIGADVAARAEAASSKSAERQTQYELAIEAVNGFPHLLLVATWEAIPLYPLAAFDRYLERVGGRPSVLRRIFTRNGSAYARLDKLILSNSPSTLPQVLHEWTAMAADVLQCRQAMDDATSNESSARKALGDTQARIRTAGLRVATRLNVEAEQASAVRHVLSGMSAEEMFLLGRILDTDTLWPVLQAAIVSEYIRDASSKLSLKATNFLKPLHDSLRRTIRVLNRAVSDGHGSNPLPYQLHELPDEIERMREVFASFGVFDSHVSSLLSRLKTMTRTEVTESHLDNDSVKASVTRLRQLWLDDLTRADAQDAAFLSEILADSSVMDADGLVTEQPFADITSPDILQHVVSSYHEGHDHAGDFMHHNSHSN